jgi:hypothetical protein
MIISVNSGESRQYRLERSVGGPNLLALPSHHIDFRYFQAVNGVSTFEEEP